MAKNDSVEVIGIQALGMIETRGLVSCIEAADAMAKASNVETIFLANSAGGLNPQLNVGDFVVVRDLLILPSVPDFSPDFYSDETNIPQSPFNSELGNKLIRRISCLQIIAHGLVEGILELFQG